MSAIVFTNSGEIDVRSISTFGVSVKESENPIGFFGTGLKYAIAVLLRTGHRVSVLSGLRRIDFELQSDSIRGKAFQFVVMRCDGGEPQPMGFTTELGKQWEVWMAYRELACNCMDEAGASERSHFEPSPRAGVTQVIVSGAEFEAAYASRSEFILDDKPWMTLKGVEIRNRQSRSLFYRGVRVGDLQQPARLCWNVTAEMKLTEDRTLADQWSARRAIAIGLLGCDDLPLVQSILLAPQDTFEADLDFHGWSSAPIGKVFLDAIESCIKDRLGHINQTAMKVWQESERARVEPQAVTLSRVQLEALRRAQAFCERIGFRVSSYPLVVAESLGPGVLGLAQHGRIYLASRVFDQGTKQLASTLIEEYLHLKHGFKDCTRELQTFLFDRVVSMGEELQGQPL